MTEYKNYNDLIEAYFDQRIIEVERKALEEEAERDPIIAEKIRLQREALIALEVLGKEEAAANIKEIHEALKGERGQKRSRLVKFAGGISLAIALGLFAIWGPLDVSLNKSKPKDPPKEVIVVKNISAAEQANQYIHSEAFQYSLDQQQAGSLLSNEAHEAFKKGSYELTINELEGRLSQNKRRNDSRFVLGLSYLADEKPRQASKHFIYLIKKESHYNPEASWYLALAYFQDNMLIQAMGLMEQISHNSSNPHQADAQNFLEKLRK